MLHESMRPVFLYLHVIDDWIIFYCDDGLFRMRTDGSNLSPIIEIENFVTTVNICDDWIFYSYRYITDEGRLTRIYKIRIDGTGHTLVNEVSLLHYLVEDGWIYFSGYHGDYDTPGLYKMRIDGSELRRINDDYAAYLNAFDGWIYYLMLTSASERINIEPGIYRIRADGTGREMVTALNFDSLLFMFNVTTDWTYLTTLRRNTDIGRTTPNMYRIRHDGTEREIVYQTRVEE
jgi:hypothetical protein